MTEHVFTVGPVEAGGSRTGVPAYAYRCSCGARGVDRIAVATMTGRVTSKARTDALEQARTDALEHQREARRRG